MVYTFDSKSNAERIEGSTPSGGTLYYRKETMSKDVDDFRQVLSHAYMRDKEGNVYYGEQLALAMLLKVKKTRNRSDKDEQALKEYVAGRSF